MTTLLSVDSQPRRLKAGITLIRPAIKSEPARDGRRFLKPFRQIIESVIQTLKAQLNLERHGGLTPPGIAARVLQRILALIATIWYNETTQQPGPPTPSSHTTTNPLELTI